MGTRVALGNGSDRARCWPRTPQRPAPLQPASTPGPRRWPKGQQYVLIDLEMTYVDGATETDSPFHGVDLAVVGDDGELVTPADSPCTAPAPAFDVDLGDPAVAAANAGASASRSTPTRSRAFASSPNRR